ncbi:MAG: GIY-YIG nuclease family protein [Sulfuritalea sp.]|nr:GIY-YIG nuclease family protein [Sulfuritalea sp.]
MGDPSGLAWAKHWKNKHDKRREAATRSREAAEANIEWLLPSQLLPVRSERRKFLSDTYFTCWYVQGATKPVYFVYLLQDAETQKVRYVGLTDDPPRRLMEHRRSKKLGQFRISVVAVGDETTEREWIARQLEAGCNLLNKVSTNHHSAG